MPTQAEILDYLQNTTLHPTIAPPQSQAVAELDAAMGRPEWSNPGYSLDQRLQSFVGTHAMLGSQDQAAVTDDHRQQFTQQLAQHFPGFHPGTPLQNLNQLRTQQQFDRMMPQAQREAAANYHPPSVMEEWIHHGMGFVSPLLGLAGSTSFASAINRINQGMGTAADYRTVAENQHSQQVEKEMKDRHGLLWTALRGLQGLGAMAGELAAADIVGGWVGAGIRAPQAVTAGQALGTIPRVAPSLLSSAGLRGLLGAGISHLGTTARALPRLPSMWAPAIGGQFEEHPERAALQNVAAGTAIAYIQTYIIGSLGAQTKTFIPGSDLASQIGKYAVALPIGLGETQVADALTGGMGLTTGYGIIGELAQGRGGDALHMAVAQAIPFAVFGLMHGNEHAPTRILEAQRDALNQMSRSGLSRQTAGDRMNTVHDALIGEIKTNPNLTSTEARDFLNNRYGPGTLRDYGFALAESLPQQPIRSPGVPNGTPATPPADARPGSSPITPQQASAALTQEQGRQQTAGTPRPLEIGAKTPPQATQPPAGPAPSPKAPDAVAGQPGRRPAEVSPVGQAVSQAFPGAETTPAGRFTAKIGERTVWVDHDQARNTVRIDFEGPKAAPGKLDLARGLKTLVDGLAKQGTAVEFMATDSNRQQLAKGRAKGYADVLGKAGYEQTSGPGIDKSDMYTFKPKAAEPTGDKAKYIADKVAQGIDPKNAGGMADLMFDAPKPKPFSPRQEADHVGRQLDQARARLADAKIAETKAGRFKDMVGPGMESYRPAHEAARQDRLAAQKEVERLTPIAEGIRQKAAAIPERRQDLGRRKLVSEMSPDERSKELLSSQIVDLPNRRAFDEAQQHEKAGAIGYSDADGLKALNDKHGYEAGNALLRAKAEALREAGVDAYHEKGDEFLHRAKDPAELNTRLDHARQILRERVIQFEVDGKLHRFKGADFSFGVGHDIQAAEKGLKAHKSDREARGERARGELRGITEIGPEALQVQGDRASVAKMLAKGRANAPRPSELPPGPGHAAEGMGVVESGRKGVRVEGEIAQRLADLGHGRSLEDRMHQAGLTALERHILRRRLERPATPSHETIAHDPEAVSPTGERYTRERIHQIELEAVAKLKAIGTGEEKGRSVSDIVHVQEQIDSALAMMERGGTVSAKDLHLTPDEAASHQTKHTAAKEKLDKLAEQLLEEAKSGKLTPQRLASFGDEAARAHQATRGVAREHGEPAGPTEGPTSVRRETADPGLAGRGTETAAPQTRPDASVAPQGTKGRRQSQPEANRPEPANAGGSPAASDKLSFKDRMFRSKGVPKEYDALAREAGINPDWLHHLARDEQRLDKEHVDSHNAMLDDAKRVLMSDNHWSPQKLASMLRTNEDGTLIRGIDLVASEMDGPHKHTLAQIVERESAHAGNELHPSNVVWRLLREGKITVDEKRAYESALNQLQALKDAEVQHGIQVELGQGASAADIAETLRAAAEGHGRESETGAALGERAGEHGEDAAEHELAGERPSGQYEPGATDFAFGANEPGQRAGIEETAAGMLADQIAARTVPHVGTAMEIQTPTPAPSRQIVAQAASAARNLFQKIRDGLRQLAGAMAPGTTRHSPDAGNTIARYVASEGYAKELTPTLIDKVLGPETRPNDRVVIGAVLTEMRLRYMREKFIERGETEKAKQVNSIIGQGRGPKEYLGNPLWSEGDYQAYLKDPTVQAAIARYKEHVVPIMEKNFRAAEGLEADEAIPGYTQLPGLPMNLKAYRSGEPAPESVVFYGQGQGNLKAPKQQKLGFAREATGAATNGYDVDLGAIIENSIAKSTSLAAKAEMYRTLKAEGLARWDVPGQLHEQDGVRMKELPGVKPPKGTQDATPEMTSLYLHPDAYQEVRQALAVDQPLPKIWGTSLLSKATLASTVEAAYHGKNLLTFLFKPGVSPVDLVKNVYKVVTGSKETAAKLVELARIGALKEHSSDSGFLWGGKTDPTVWTSNFLDVIQRSMRVTADQAFNRLQSQGRVEGSEGNRRDFINQMGQYNKRAQNRLVVALRDTGLGPFATAGTNYYMQGLRALTMDPGVKATSFGAAVGLRAEMLAKTASIFAGVALVNFLRWKSMFGDDKTPLGAIKIGEANGKTSYLDLLALTGFTRGARETGLLAWAEGSRPGAKALGTTSGDILDRAVHDIFMSALHPAIGPAVQFGHVAMTGTNTLGSNVAAHAKPGESQAALNFQAAFWQANPVISALTGMDHPGQTVSWEERLNKLLGPFGMHWRASVPGAPHRTRTISAPTPEQRLLSPMLKGRKKV